MPVEDHDVHEKVKVDHTFRYGCNSLRNPNRSMGEYYSPDRVYRPNGTFYVILRNNEHRMSKSCRNFYLWDTDPACEGCTTERDTEYANRMKDLT